MSTEYYIRVHRIAIQFSEDIFVEHVASREEAEKVALEMARDRWTSWSIEDSWDYKVEFVKTIETDNETGESVVKEEEIDVRPR